MVTGESGGSLTVPSEDSAAGLAVGAFWASARATGSTFDSNAAPLTLMSQRRGWSGGLVIGVSSGRVLVGWVELFAKPIDGPIHAERTNDGFRIAREDGPERPNALN